MTEMPLVVLTRQEMPFLNFLFKKKFENRQEQDSLDADHGAGWLGNHPIAKPGVLVALEDLMGVLV